VEKVDAFFCFWGRGASDVGEGELGKRGGKRGDDGRKGTREQSSPSGDGDELPGSNKRGRPFEEGRKSENMAGQENKTERSKWGIHIQTKAIQSNRRRVGKD